MKRRDTGLLGEKIASDFLARRGYRILKTNYRCPHGEIDIIARHQDFLVFIEVRTRRSLKFGSPEESITPAKKERLIATAWHYQQSLDSPLPLWRIDTVVIELNRKGSLSRIELIENAITENQA